MKVKTSNIGLCNITIGHENIDRTPSQTELCFVARMEMPIAHAVKHRALLNDLKQFSVNLSADEWDKMGLNEFLEQKAYGSNDICECAFFTNDIIGHDNRDAVWAKHAAMMLKAMEITLADVQINLMVVESA